MHPPLTSLAPDSAQYQLSLGLTFAQRAFCAAAIFLRLAAEIIRFGLAGRAPDFCFAAQRAFLR